MQEARDKLFPSLDSLGADDMDLRNTSVPPEARSTFPHSPVYMCGHTGHI